MWQDAEKVRQRQKTWRVKRETCEKSATWTEWIPTSSRPSRSSSLSRSAILGGRELPGPEGTAIEMDELRARIKPYPTVLQPQRDMANLSKLNTGNIEVERLPLDM